jgi:amidase
LNTAARVRLSWAVVVAIIATLLTSPVRAARTFELTGATLADINAAFEAGALTSEQLTRLYVARIDAYDTKGPRINAVLTLNPRALEEARVLDAERKLKGPRGPLHGVPVLLKANIEVADLPATAGFYGLRGSIAQQDAEQTKRLRAAGCVILGLANMSEFATGPAISTLGGQIRNPHAPDRTPTGSSGGSGAAIAAGFAALALGTDTGGSVRGPAAVNGIVGLRPTFGLAGRGGIIPLALSLDTIGPMAGHVADLAAMLTVMAGSDPRDKDALSRPAVDYASGLAKATLKGARLGLVREYLGADARVDAVVNQAVAVLRQNGAEVVDVSVGYLPRLTVGTYERIRDTEFRFQIEDYLSTLKLPGLPKTHADILRLSERLTMVSPEGWVPNPVRLAGHRAEAAVTGFRDQLYISAAGDVRKVVRDVLTSVMESHRLDALLGPTALPPRLIAEESVIIPPGWRTLAPLAGWPDLSIPAGLTDDLKLPVGISLLGRPLSDRRLLELGHAFEQASKARRTPAATPALPGERIEF